MPVVTVQIFDGRDVEVKRELAASLTRETARIVGCREEHVHVVIEEVSRENWAVGGVLCSERQG
jgi:4-oxalocrotonate tautomerase